MQDFKFSLGDDNTLVSLDLRGTGPTVAFIHGWCCRKTDFAEISARSPAIQSLSVDLPHHGSTVSSRGAWTVSQLGALVAASVRAAGLRNVTLVGHSMGAAVALEAALELGSEARKVIALDGLTYLNMYPRQPENVVAKTLEPFVEDFRSAIAALIEHAFLPGADALLQARIREEMTERPSAPMLAQLRSLLEWDMDKMLNATSVSVVILASRTFLSEAAIERYGRRCTIIPADLGGHFFFREDPHGTAELLAAFL